jgi:hypothetical protein
VFSPPRNTLLIASLIPGIFFVTLWFPLPSSLRHLPDALNTIARDPLTLAEEERL